MKNTTKKILEWLEQAKADGYEWADAAIENCTYANNDAQTLRAAIMYAFKWGETPQGVEFWHDIYKSLKAK